MTARCLADKPGGVVLQSVLLNMFGLELAKSKLTSPQSRLEMFSMIQITSSLSTSESAVSSLCATVSIVTPSLAKGPE